MAQLGKRIRTAREGIDPRQALSARRGGEDGEGAGQGEIRRDHRGRDESRRRSRAMPTRWCAASSICRTAPAAPCGSAVFARGAKADEAKAAGADVVGAEDLVEKVQGGTIDFDRCIATPDMMPLVGRLGKVLGPRGMMPNPKVGTVTMDVTTAVKGAKGGSVEFRVEKAGIVQAGVGKASFPAEQAGGEHQGVRGRRAKGQARRRQGHLHPARRGVLDHGAGGEGGAVVAVSASTRYGHRKSAVFSSAPLVKAGERVYFALTSHRSEEFG